MGVRLYIETNREAAAEAFGIDPSKWAIVDSFGAAITCEYDERGHETQHVIDWLYADDDARFLSHWETFGMGRVTKYVWDDLVEAGIIGANEECPCGEIDDPKLIRKVVASQLIHIAPQFLSMLGEPTGPYAALLKHATGVYWG